MTVEAKQIQAGVDTASDHASRRMRITPPPLVPGRHKRTGGSMARTALVVALLALAGIAHFTGASPIVTGGLVVIGLVVLSMQVSELRERRRLASLIDESAARNRQEMEHLADRMWELQESEARFHGLIDALGDIVVHRDRHGRIVEANRVLADMLGSTPQALVGRSLAELGIDIGVVPDSAFSDGEYLSSTDVAIRTEAGTRWFSWIELSVRDEGNGAVSHRAVARDITARKRAETTAFTARERAETANQAKSRFLATVSHEIRTPMNGIMGMAKLLADTTLTPEQRTYVGAVSTSASALLALIEDLLDYSKIEAGRFELEPQQVSPRELVENVVELLAPRAYGKGVGLGCHVSPCVPGLISADPGRLRQVLLNVVGNAVKFTDEGGVLVTMEMERDTAGPLLRIDVADTGPGLQQDDIARLFEEFEQGDDTSTRRHGGAGLGLAISRRIIEAMGGTIAAAGEAGTGAQFTIRIPVSMTGGADNRNAEKLAGRRTVILSANLMEAEAIARTIAAHGGEAEIARTVEEAAAGGRRRPYDVALIDAAMERTDGSLLRRLRAAGVRPAEAITLIAPADRGHLAEYRASGYDTFLARPVRGETLLRVMLSSPARQERAGSPAPHTAPEPAASTCGLNVLVAEDNDINALLARAALTKAGHRVEIVGNGKAAVEALTAADGSQRYDVVLMDLHMPVMDGMDAIGHIRKHEEAKGIPGIPILMLSADSQESTRHKLIAHGATGFLTKPFEPQMLIDAVESHARS